MPTGGERSSLVDMANNLAARQAGPNVSYSFGNTAASVDITQFKDTFQSGGIFSPGYPAVPTNPQPIRRFNYPASYNTTYTPRSHETISFKELRGLAESHDITRLAIETRKDQIESLEWTINSIDNKDIAGDAQDRADALIKFFQRPDGRHRFGTWLRELIEDLLVIDAPALEVIRNRGGDIIALEVVDGATIKVLLDETGRTPQPPAPAYEQIIHGRPWVLAEDGGLIRPDPAQPLFESQILYLPRNPRPHKTYGYSPVEQIVMTVNTALRRQYQQLQYFTDGNVPLGLVNGPEGWTSQQLTEYQEWFDTLLAGNTANRTKLIWSPFGSKYYPFLENPYKDKFDEWLSRIVCFAFSLPPNAFVERVNRATAETAQEAAIEEGLGSLQTWVKRLMDTVIQDRMGHTDLEFSWTPPPELDTETLSKVLDLELRVGLRSINEGRDALGLDPVEGGDNVMVWTKDGPIPLVLASQITQHPLVAASSGEDAAAGGAPGKEPGSSQGGSAPTDE